MMHCSSRVLIIGLVVALWGIALSGDRAQAAGQSGETIVIVDDVCEPSEIWLDDGGCASCPLGYVPDAAQERCVEDPSWSVPPDPCELDPTLCVGPTDPVPDPDVPDDCEGPMPTDGRTSCRECFDCLAVKDSCLSLADRYRAECAIEAIKRSFEQCRAGIYGPTETNRPIIDPFNWRDPQRYAAQMLNCMDGHLHYTRRVSDGVDLGGGIRLEGITHVYGGMMGECDARLFRNRRTCQKTDCSDVCRASTATEPQSLTTTEAAAGEVPMRPVTVSLPTTHDGYLVDHCRFWSRDCGLLAAHQYCRNRYGRLSRAMAYQVVEDIGAQTPTRTLLGGEVCDQDFCDAFASITCGVDALPVRFEYTRTEAGRLAYCDGSGTECGQPVADQFCREAFGQTSYASAASEDMEFAGVEPTVALDGSLCAGSDCRAFRGITCRSPELLAESLDLGRDDGDGDAVPVDVDNCPWAPNSRLEGPPIPHQRDRDLDGIGDACDADPDMPAWVGRGLEVAMQSAGPALAPAATRTCRERQLAPVASWIEADVACVQSNLEHPDADAFELCRAEAALRLANALEDVIERTQAHGKACPLIGSPTAIFELIDDLGARAMVHYELVIARIDVAEASERAVAHRVFETMADDVRLAIRKAGRVVKGKPANRYEKLAARLRDGLAADFAHIEAESATLGVRLHPDWLATNTLGFVRDVVDRLSTAD